MPLKTNEWFLPTRTNNGATCVETRFIDNTVSVRNSGQREGGTADFTHPEWEVFIAGVKDGDYDL